MLFSPAVYVSQVNDCRIRNRESLGRGLHNLGILFSGSLRSLPVAFEQALAELFVKRRRNRHLDSRIDKVFRLGSASGFANGIAQAASLFIAFFNALVTGFALLLGARNPNARVSIDLDRLGIALRL